jgi:hypothetical protein
MNSKVLKTWLNGRASIKIVINLQSGFKLFFMGGIKIITREFINKVCGNLAVDSSIGCLHGESIPLVVFTTEDFPVIHPLKSRWINIMRDRSLFPLESYNNLMLTELLGNISREAMQSRQDILIISS